MTKAMWNNNNKKRYDGSVIILDLKLYHRSIVIEQHGAALKQKQKYGPNEESKRSA